MRNTWGKIILIVVPLVIGGFIAGVRMNEKVTRLETDFREARNSHVTRAELQGQLDAILRELAGLREDVRDLRRSR